MRTVHYFMKRAFRLGFARCSGWFSSTKRHEDGQRVEVVHALAEGFFFLLFSFFSCFFASSFFLFLLRVGALCALWPQTINPEPQNPEP